MHVRPEILHTQMPRGESPYDASIAAGEAGEAVSAESLSQDPVVSREQSQDVKTRREDSWGCGRP